MAVNKKNVGKTTFFCHFPTFFTKSESRAQAHTDAVAGDVDVVVAQTAIDEASIPRAAGTILRRRPTVIAKSLTTVI